MDRRHPNKITLLSKSLQVIQCKAESDIFLMELTLPADFEPKRSQTFRTHSNCLKGQYHKINRVLCQWGVAIGTPFYFNVYQPPKAMLLYCTVARLAVKPVLILPHVHTAHQRWTIFCIEIQHHVAWNPTMAHQLFTSIEAFI